MKSKYVASVLAFFFGIFGMHRFYLGQRFLGMVSIFLFFMGMLISFEEPGRSPAAFFIALPAILGFIDSILLAVMPQEDFDERYNRKRLKRQENYGPPRKEPRIQQLPMPVENVKEKLSELKRLGIEKFREFDFESAVVEFQKVLEIKAEDPATHFNLACCYSVLENKDAAFYHLDQAVKAGFTNYDKIKNHDSLAYLRTQPEYDAFIKNNYQLPNVQPAPEVKPENAKPKEEALVLRDDLLDQIIQLGELRNKGILTEAEFAKQKEKVLAQR